VIEKLLNELNSNISSNLRYRTFNIQDMNLLNDIFKDKNVMKVDGALRDDKWIKNWIETQISSYEKNGFGHLALFSKGNYSVSF
jgi:hypothetical protein